MNNNKLYEIRYRGDYGFSLHSAHSTIDAAKTALIEAARTAIANGNRELAKSFKIV